MAEVMLGAPVQESKLTDNEAPVMPANVGTVVLTDEVARLMGRKYVRDWQDGHYVVRGDNAQ